MEYIFSLKSHFSLFEEVTCVCYYSLKSIIVIFKEIKYEIHRQKERN